LTASTPARYARGRDPRAQATRGRHDAGLAAVPYLIMFVFVCLLGILATCVLL
jgi:hypothetical protein